MLDNSMPNISGPSIPIPKNELFGTVIPENIGGC